MKQYQYKVVVLKIPTTLSQEKFNQKLEEQLNAYGESGWELCSVEKGFAVFKRELTSVTNS